MTTDYESPGGYTARMVARFSFRLCKATVCPRVVAGKRCLFCHSINGQFCPCRRWSGTQLYDHPAIWRTGAGRQYVMTLEPYWGQWIDQPQVDRFRIDLAQLGLELEITDESYWYHGTRLLMIRRQPSTTV